MTSTCIIVGASHAGAELALTLRKEGWEGSIVVIGNEQYLPYHRPPLSKNFLVTDQDVNDVLIRKADFFEKFNISFRLGTHVRDIDRLNKAVMLSNGETLSYQKLALCTGSRVRKVTVPGCDLRGMYYLRNIDDVLAIKSAVKRNGKAVIVGGGYVGLEIAASLKQLGMHVIVLEMEARVLKRVTAEEVSDFFTRIHTEEGVEIMCNKSVTGFLGRDGFVDCIECQDGTYYSADLVVIGIGILPNVELAEAAGLEVENGILVDDLACTSDPHIVSAGDCTNHPNQLLDCRLRLESVPNALEQARTAASSLCGKHKPYASIPWFWSDQYNVKLQIVGLNKGYDEKIVRGDHTSGRDFVAFYLNKRKLISAECVNRPKEFLLMKQVISKGLDINIARLGDDTVAVKDLVIAQSS